MAIAQQDRYSAMVDAKLRYSLVQKDGIIWNTRYEGNPKAGAVKVPVRDTEATVGTYNKATGITASNAVGSFLTVNIDKDVAVNEVIDNYDAAAVPDNIIADRLDSAGYSLALKMNDDGTDVLIAQGTVMADTGALTKNSIYEAIVDARTEMSKAKVPLQGRWLLVTPSTFTLLLKSPEFISASNLGDDVKQTGAVGSIAGFTVYEDATVEGKTTSTNATVDFIAGHPDWCCRVQEWAVEPHVQDLNGDGKHIGASAVQGRKVYAHKVTKAVAVMIKTTAAKV